MNLSLEAPTHIHLVGIGGAGMSGIARILLQRGQRVSGSDLREGRAVEELRVLGARVAVGHDATNLRGADVVVTSTAVPAENVEVMAANRRGLPVLRRADMLAALMQDDTSVLVSGTHGKTTTTSMIVVALQAAGGDPSFAIGGSLNESGTNAHAGTDRRFVAEADESDRSFLAYRPDVAVVTNIEHDHPEEFADHEQVAKAFEEFLGRRTPLAPAVMCVDDPACWAVARNVEAPVIGYGTHPSARIRAIPGSDGVNRLCVDGEDRTSFTLAVPGRHNVLNATAALAVCHQLGVDLEPAAVGLGRFTGATRRFQRLGEVAGISVVDDYAHHPTELRATLAAARSIGAGRIVLVVQPHRYSRTQVFGEELGRAAAGADVVVVTDVYGAGETPVPGVTGRLVADAAEAAGANVVYRSHLGDVVSSILGLVRAGDLVLTTGAGDVTHIGPALLSRLGASAW